MLSRRKALVTGASQGVGAAIAETLAAEGAHVCLAARRAEALEETARRCREHGAAGVTVHPCDLTDSQQVNQLAVDLLDAHSCIDVLVNCAGAYPDSGRIDPLEGDPDAWEKTFGLNVLAPMRLTCLLTPAMAQNGWGQVVNVGSVAGTKAVADEGAYAASKWAIKGWSVGCYESLSKHGIKTVLIEPSHVATAMAQAQEGSRYKEMRTDLMITPRDVAEAVLLPSRLSAAGDPVEIVLNRLQTPYEA